MKCLTVLILVGLVAADAAADENDLVYQEVIPGVEAATYIDPVVDVNGQLAGMVYTVPDSHFVAIKMLDADSSVLFRTGLALKKAISRVAGDSLVVYALVYTDHPILAPVNPQIYSMTLWGNELSVDSVQLPAHVRSYLYGPVDYLVDCDLIFDYQRGTTCGVILSHRIHYNVWDMTMGYGDGYVAVSHLVSLNLDTVLFSNEADRLITANLQDNHPRDYLMADNFYSSYTYYDDRWGQSGSYSGTIVSVVAVSSTQLYEKYLKSCYTDALFADEFIPSQPGDEILYSGNSPKLTDAGGSATSNLACYNFSHIESGKPELIWYLPIKGVKFSHIYRRQQLIVGMKGKSEVVSVNYVNGTTYGSEPLDRALDAAKFFEITSGDQNLALVGRTADTVFVYQFRTITDASEDDLTQNLPRTVALHQNYPNPFNGETVISFDINHREAISLKIYNLLGQEVRRIATGAVSPGSHRYSWDGLDDRGNPVAGGIYFAKLDADQGSAVIKMVYLK